MIIFEVIKNKMEILKDFKNDLLKRQEVSLNLEAEQNPNFDDMKKQIAEQFKKSEDVIDVYNIKGSFGSNEFEIDAYIYDSKEDLEKSKRKKEKDETQEKPKEETKESSGEEEQKLEEKPVEEKEIEKPKESSGEGSAPVEDKAEEAKAVEKEKQGEEKTK